MIWWTKQCWTWISGQKQELDSLTPTHCVLVVDSDEAVIIQPA